MIDPMSNLVDELSLIDRSGHDVDIFGEPTPPATCEVPRPNSGEPCVRHDSQGHCPPGCTACLAFLGEWEEIHHRDTEDTE